MPNAQNGWPVIPNTPAGREKLDQGPLIRNVFVPNGVRAGSVATVFRWLAREYDARVERLIPGWCWGWHVKHIEGNDDWSNHSAGCAVDFNAPDNPMAAGSTDRSMTVAQIRECHALETESGGVLRWGGDFRRDDPMHWEIVGTPDQVAAFAVEILEENDMPSAEEIAKAVWSYDADKATPGTQTAGGLLLTENRRSNATTNQDVPRVLADVADLKAMVRDLAAQVSALHYKISNAPVSEHAHGAFGGRVIREASGTVAGTEEQPI